MSDILIRDVPADVLARVDKQAARMGLSRSEYLRRRIEQDTAGREHSLTTADLARAAELSRDLLDEDVMRDAWS